MLRLTHTAARLAARSSCKTAVAATAACVAAPRVAAVAVAPRRSFAVSRPALSSAASGADDSRPAIRPALTSFSDEETMLRETVAQFAREVIGPRVAHMDEQGQLDPMILQQLFNQGLMGVETPLEYGGGGMSFTQSCIVIEELAKVDPAISVIVDIQNTLINTSIMKYGSEALKNQWLPRLATDTLGSFCLSESGSGSDAFAMATRAEKQADGSFVINGSKMWISNAKEAGLFLIFANADPSKGYKGITAFLVPAGTPGLTVGKKENKLGIRASSTCELSFDGLRVPASSVLGKEGEGYKIAIGSLNEGRIGIGAQMVGLAAGAFEAPMEYIHSRKQFGTVIASYQGMQFSVAQMATEIECARLMVYNAARLKEQGLPFVQQAAMAKLKASQVAERVASQAVEWMGGIGFTKDCPSEKFYRDAKIGEEETTRVERACRVESIVRVSGRLASLTFLSCVLRRLHLRGHNQFAVADDCQEYLKELHKIREQQERNRDSKQAELLDRQVANQPECLIL